MQRGATASDREATAAPTATKRRRGALLNLRGSEVALCTAAGHQPDEAPFPVLTGFCASPHIIVLLNGHTTLYFDLGMTAGRCFARASIPSNKKLVTRRSRLRRCHATSTLYLAGNSPRRTSDLVQRDCVTRYADSEKPCHSLSIPVTT